MIDSGDQDADTPLSGDVVEDLRNGTDLLGQGRHSDVTVGVTDRAAIVDTVVAYATAVDTRNWAALAGLFTDDARWEYGATGEQHDGPASIVAGSAPASKGSTPPST